MMIGLNAKAFGLEFHHIPSFTRDLNDPFFEKTIPAYNDFSKLPAITLKQPPLRTQYAVEHLSRDGLFTVNQHLGHF